MNLVGTGYMLDALVQAGHVAVVKPWPVNPAVSGGSSVDVLVVDGVARTVACPNGG